MKNTSTLEPEEFLKTLQNLVNGDTSAENWQQLWDKVFKTFQEKVPPYWLLMPTTSYTREWQDYLHENLGLWMTFLRAQQEYIAQFSKMGLQSIERLRDKLGTTLSEPVSHDTRALYSLWLDSAQEAYTQCVSTEEYREILAHLLNTLMAWKQHERKMLDSMLGTLDLPTRKELDQFNALLQQVRSEVKNIQAEQYGANIDEMHTEINALRAELDMLKNVGKKPTPVSKRIFPKAEETPPITKPKISHDSDEV